MGEFATAVKYDLPIKVVIIKNNTLGQIKWEQIVFLGNPEYEVALHPIDFVKFAEACGGVGFRCEKPDEVRPALETAFGSNKPAIVEAVVDPFEPPMPAQATPKQALNFAKGLARGEPARRRDHHDGLQGQDQGAGLSPPGGTAPPDTGEAAITQVAMDSRIGPMRPDRRASTASAYRVPTDAPESDGTYRLGRDDAGARRGHGRRRDRASATRTPTGRRRPDRPRQLADVVRGRDAMDVPGAWAAMGTPIRNLGRPGVASMAISAVDAALWDLKAKLLGLPLVDLLGAARDAVPVYGSGGFTSYSIDELQRAARRLGRAGLPAGEDEGRPPPGRRPRPRPRRPRRDRARRRAVRRRQRRLRPQAGPGAGRAVRRAGRDLVRGAGLVGRPGRPAPAPRPGAGGRWTIAAGEYGYDLPDFRRMLEAGAVDVLQADATRCAASPGSCGPRPWRRPLGCRSRPTAPRACTSPPAAPSRRAAPGVLPRPRPDRAHALRRRPAPRRRRAPAGPSRPGLGLEFKRPDAARFAV